jgi:3-hydroxy-9,10-secoandrosta-1,3,5(10)-triene-9,17-dione monooxygenase reductase component
MPKNTLSLNKASSALFREGLTRFATGVTVVTSVHGKIPVGVTISSFAGVSLKPPLVLFCLDEKCSALPAFKKRGVFAIHILAEDQEHLAHVFARQTGRDWKKLKPKKHASGVPLLNDVMAVLVCRLTQKHKAGDHHIIVGRVMEIGINGQKPRPLLHTQRHYWALGKKK